MEAEVEIQEPQLQQEPDPPKKKLWKSLSDKHLYTKSYEDFGKQFSTPESIDKLHKVLSEKELYTKTTDDFKSQFFSDLSPEVKKKVGRVDLEGSSLEAGNSLSQSNGVGGGEIPTVEMYNLPNGEMVEADPISLSKKYNELKGRKKEISTGTGSSFAVGTGSTLVDDEEAQKSAKKLREDFKDTDLEGIHEETKDLSEGILANHGKRLMQERNDNPQLYQRDLANLKWRNDFEHTILNDVDKGNIDPENYNRIKHGIEQLPISTGQGDYTNQRAAIKSLAEDLRTYGGENKDKLLKNFAIEVSKVYGNPDNKAAETFKDTPESKYLTPEAQLGYQYLQDVSPDKAEQYKRLFIDAKSLKDKPDELKGYNHLMQTLEETGIGLKQNAVTEELNSLNNQAKQNGGLSPEQIERATKLEKVNEELSAKRNEMDSKYPDRIDDKVDDAVQEIMGQRLGGRGNLLDRGIGYSQYLGGKAWQGIRNTAQGVWEAASTPFMSDASNNLRELAIMGETLEENKIYHKTDKNKNVQYDAMVIQPELQKQIDEIKNNGTLTNDAKEQKLYTLLRENTDKFGRVPIKGGKFNINPSSIMYGLTDLGTQLLPFVGLEAVTGGGATAGLARKFVSTFTAAAATTFHDEYANAVMQGKSQSDAYKSAMASTAITSFAMAGASTPTELRAMAKGNSSAEKIIQGMSDKAIQDVLDKGTPKGLTKLKQAFVDRAKATPEMISGGLKTGAKFEAYMAGANELNGKEQNFKQSLLNIANFGIMGAGLGHVGYKSPTELQKGSIVEFGKNPDAFRSELDDMKKNGMSQSEYDHRKMLIDKSEEAYKTLPKANAKGQPLTEKEKGEYMYNTVIKNEGKKSASTLPPKQAEKAEMTAMVADHANDIILDTPTDKQLQDRKDKLEKALIPEKDADGKNIEIPEKELLNTKAELQAVNDELDTRKSFQKVEIPRKDITPKEQPTVSETEGAGSSGVGGDVDATAKKIVGESAFDKLKKEGYTIEKGKFDSDAYASFFGLHTGVQADKFANAGLRLVKPSEKIKVYRGKGKNVAEGENEGVTWVAEDKKVAENYSGDGSVEEVEVSKPKNPFPNPTDTIHVKGSDVGNKLKGILNRLFREGKVTKEQAIEASKAIDEFVSAAGEESELYSTKTNKKGVSSKYVKALQALGFDGIVQKESYNSGSPFTATKTGNETNTYGIFKAVEQSLKAEDKAPVTKPEGKSDVVVDEGVKPIKQLGSGANVYFETKKYRVNEDLKNGGILLNVGDEKGEVPLANIKFKDVNEAVFVAKKLEENAPQGLVSDFHNIDKIIENYKQEFKDKSPKINSNEKESNTEGQNQSSGDSTPKFGEKSSKEKQLTIAEKAKQIEDVTDPYDRVLQHFATDGKIHGSAIEELFGGKDKRIRQKSSTENERRARISLIGKDAPTIDGLAHDLWESDKTGKHTTEDYKDAIERVLLDYNSKAAMQKDLVERYDYDAAYEKYINQAYGKEAMDVVNKMTDDEINHILRLESEKASEEEIANYIDGLSENKPIVNEQPQESEVVNPKTKEGNPVTEPNKIEPEAEEGTGEEKVTGVKKEITSETRAANNMPKVEFPKMGTDIEELNAAKERVDSGKSNPQELVNRILTDKTGYKNEADVFDMQYYAHQLQKKNNDLNAQLAEAKTSEEKLDIVNQKMQLSDLIDAQTEAAQFAGNKWGKIGNAMQPVINDAGQIFRENKAIIKEAYGGEVPKEVKARLDAITKERDEAIAQRDKVEAQLKEKMAERGFEEMKKRAAKSSKNKESKEALQKEEQDLLKELKKSLKKDLGNLNSGFPIPTATLNTLGKLAINYVKQGVNGMEALVDKMYNALKDEGISRKDIKDFLVSHDPLHAEMEAKRLNKKADIIEDKLVPPSVDSKGRPTEPTNFITPSKVEKTFRNHNEWVKANQRVANAEFKMKIEKRKAFESQKNMYQRALSWAGRLTRLSVLSGYNVLGKLASAATIGSAAKRPIEQIIGQVYATAFSGIAKKAPIEGYFNAKSEAKFYKEFFNPKKFVKNSWEILKTGSSQLGKRLGSAEYEHVPGLYLPTDLHQIIKDPPKRATFEASFRNGLIWAEKNGLDINDPLVINSLENAAYKRAQYEIFQEQNWLSKKFTSYKSALEKKGNVGNSVKFLIDFMIPVSTVPTNIVRRVITTSPLGLIRGGKEVVEAYRKGIESLKPEEADHVMQQLKQGSLGTALWLIGWYGASQFGGLYSKYNPDKQRKEGEMASDEMEVGGKMIPKPTQHALPLEIIQFAATARHVFDNYVDNKKESTPQAIYAAGMSSIGALLEQVPVIETGVHLVGAAGNPYEAEKLKDDVTRRFEPQILRETGIIPKKEKESTNNKKKKQEKHKKQPKK